MKKFLCLSLLLLSSIVSNAQALQQTYAYTIPTNFGSHDPTCDGPANSSISIPMPNVATRVLGIDIEYDFEAVSGGNGWMSDQRSQIHCTNTTQTESVFSGIGNSSGVMSYSRSFVSVANGSYSSGATLVFEMRAWREVFPGTPGCNSLVQRIVPNTWKITVYYSPDWDEDGYSVAEGDCNDYDAAINPGAPDYCDGIDNDCDGEIDEGVQNPCYDDNDGDGYPGDEIIYWDCTCLFDSPGGDCDDDDGGVYPGAPESCDGLDNNCDGQIDEDENLVDWDGDGYNCSVDCNNNDPAINPGAPDYCDGIDNDCDGEIDEGVQNPCYEDNDGDGYPGDEIIYWDCSCLFDSPGGDCDDDDGGVYPGAPESCDGLDNNCDGQIDEDENLVDWDGDGYNCSVDCNNNDPTIYPGAIEVCDGIDNNCDGEIDEMLLVPCYRDADADGYPSDVLEFYDCLCPPGYYTYAGGDCDDFNYEVYPGAPEISCNDIDNNCDGEQLNIDFDMDGFDCSTDCDDFNADINPGETEIIGNGIDDDCNGVVDEITCYTDADGDGYGSGGDTPSQIPCADIGMVDNNGDCDDTDPSINPSATEICGSGVDEDCNGFMDEVDEDDDGFFCSEDCDDTNPLINPGMPDICGNGIDDDCDGLIDNAVIDIDGDGFDCIADCDDDDPSIFPGGTEINGNGIDDNCNGLIDEVGNDSDGDGIDDSVDNCPFVPNILQSDSDGDLSGDLCDSDFLTTGNVGIGTENPLTKLQIENGELLINDGGIIIKSSDGSCWRLTVINDGTIQSTQVDCPL